jgi:hypothetical protein
VFKRSGATWSQQAYLKASNTDMQDYFGWSVAISGNAIVVAALGRVALPPALMGIKPITLPRVLERHMSSCGTE